MHRALTTNLSLSTSSKLSVYRVSCLRILLPSSREGPWTTTMTSISRIVITRASLLFFFFSTTSSSCSTLPGYSAGRTRGTRNYESVHDRTNRMPRRIGPLRILISIVIKFFVAPRAHRRALLLKRQ